MAVWMKPPIQTQAINTHRGAIIFRLSFIIVDPTRLSKNSVFCSEPIIRGDQNTRTIFGSPVLWAFYEVTFSCALVQNSDKGFYDRQFPQQTRLLSLLWSKHNDLSHDSVAGLPSIPRPTGQ
jgi:hypothetical protein